MGDKLTGIALALVGVAVIALLINKSDGTVSIIQAGVAGFNNLLKTVTLQ